MNSFEAIQNADRDFLTRIAGVAVQSSRFEYALRAWAIAGHETIDFFYGSPVLNLEGKGFDFGDSKRSYTWAPGQTLACAREMGDHAAADRCQ